MQLMQQCFVIHMAAVTQCARLPSGGEVKHLTLVLTAVAACAFWWFVALYMKPALTYTKPDL